MVHSSDSHAFRPTGRALRLSPIAGGVLAALTCPALALAQAADSGADQPAEVRMDRPVLEMVVVTARKRDERAIDVPIAITAVTGAEIQDKGLLNVTDVLQQTPGTAATDDGAGIGSVQIRGVSTSLGGNDNGYYIDETPFTGVTTSFYPDTRSWDLDRVEVLKGPQGTLFGEGSMGGTVRIISRAPDLSGFDAAVALQASTVADGGDGWGSKAMLNLPIVRDKLAVRLAVTEETLPGWIDNRATGEKDVNEAEVRTLRGKLRFAPTDRLTLDLSHWQSKNSSDAAGTSSLEDLTTTATSPTTNKWRTDSAVGTYDFDGSQVVLAVSDSQFDILISQNSPGITIDAGIGIGVSTAELRWASTGNRTFDWTVGYYTREASRDDTVDANVFGTPIISQSNQTNDAYAVYGEGTMHFDERWALTAGLRYFSDDVKAKSAAASGAANTLNETFSKTSPRLALSYKPAGNTTIYASAAQGFRSGQLQPINSILVAQAVGIDLQPGIDPDTILTYELGAKTLLADGKLLLDAAVFHSKWEDVAVRVPLVRGVNGLANSPGSTSYGAEFGLAYNPTTALTLQLGGSWIDATYDGDVPGTGLQDGVPVYNVPRTMLTGSATYSWNLGSLRAMAYGGVNYHSARETNALANNSTPGDSITSADARLGLQSPWGWSVFLFGTNLSNDNGAVAPPESLGEATRLQPRTFGLEMRYAFGARRRK